MMGQQIPPLSPRWGTRRAERRGPDVIQSTFGNIELRFGSSEAFYEGRISCFAALAGEYDRVGENEVAKSRQFDFMNSTRKGNNA